MIRIAEPTTNDDALVSRAHVSVVRTVAGASVASQLRSGGSLRLLAPANHGHASWVYTSSLGGGLVSGDSLRLELEVGAGATLFVSTQSQTKVFKGTARSQVHAKVAPDGLLVLWPSPVACFRDAGYVQDTLIEVGAGGSVVTLDAWTSGRPAHETPWSFQGFTSHTRIVGTDGPLLVDGTSIDPHDLADMNGFHAFATILAVGPRTQGLAEHVHQTPRDHVATSQVSDGVVASLHALPNARFVARIGAHSTTELSERLAPIREWVARELGDDPFRHETRAE
jgi:urease accessory protein